MQRSNPASFQPFRSARSSAFQQEADLNPHRVRRWLNAIPNARFAEEYDDIWETWHLAPAHAAAMPTFNIDEMTGIQALDRIAPPLSLKPGRAAGWQLEHVRHGNRTSLPASTLPPVRCSLTPARPMPKRT